MLRILFGSLLLVLLCGCGVKLPPVAPERTPDPPARPNLDCSPKDPECDRTDPNYKKH